MTLTPGGLDLLQVANSDANARSLEEALRASGSAEKEALAALRSASATQAAQLKELKGAQAVAYGALAAKLDGACGLFTSLARNTTSDARASASQPSPPPRPSRRRRRR